MYKIVFEIELEETDAANPLEAAKIIASWLEDQASGYLYYVQNDETNEVFSVDLSEDDEDAVLLIDKYVPLIR